jgi:hypothetical protein
MQVIASWTGRQADALRRSLRMSNESFAVYLDVAARTVANWRKNPDVIPTPNNQKLLDSGLARASDQEKANFAMLVGEPTNGHHEEGPHAFEIPGAGLLKASPDASAAFGDLEYLQSVRSHIGEIIALDNRFGGADLVRLSTRFFRTLHDQLGAGTYDVKLERDLNSAAGELAEVVGWLAYDAEEHDLTRRMNQESLYFSRLAGDRSIELLTLQNSSMHAAQQERPREALQIARSVLEGDYRLSPRLRALFLTRKARALAQGGDGSALHIFAEVRSLFLEGVSDGDPAWAWWIDERELSWHEAMARRDLGMADSSITYFEQSVIATPATEIRSQYLHRAYLLQSQLDNSTWGDAEQTIRQLLPLAAEVSSTRTVVLLRSVLVRIAVRDDIPRSLEGQAAMLSAALDKAPV